MAASDLCSGLAELDTYWDAETVAAAADYLDHEQDAATRIRKGFEAWKKRGADEAAAPITEADHLAANGVLNAIVANLKKAHREGLDPIEAAEAAEVEIGEVFAQAFPDGKLASSRAPE